MLKIQEKSNLRLFGAKMKYLDGTVIKSGSMNIVNTLITGPTK